MTSVAQSFRGKEATEYKPQTWSGEKGSESFTAFKMEWQRQHDESHGSQKELENAGMSQGTVDDFKEMDKRLYQVLISCTKGEAKNHVCNLERSEFKSWRQIVSHFDPRTGADRSVACAQVTHPVSQSGHPQDPRRCRVPETSCRRGNKRRQNLK